MSTSPEDKRINASALFDVSKVTKPAELREDRDFSGRSEGPRLLRIGKVDVTTTEGRKKRIVGKATGDVRKQ